MPNSKDSKPLIEIASVSVRRGGRRLLSDIDWSIRKGELWTLVGPNGAGKSTLVGLMRGQIPASSGGLTYSFAKRGRRAREPHEEIASVSFMQQSRLVARTGGWAQARWHQFDDEVPTARDLLSSCSQAREQHRLVGLLGLERLLDRKLTELSNGERRKLLLVRAASTRRSLLVLDNPFTGLDARSRSTLLRGLRTLWRDGADLLIVTSRADEIPPFATHVLLLDRGRVRVAGARTRVWRAPEYVNALAAEATPGRGGPEGSSRLAADARAPVVELRGVSLRHGGNAVVKRLTWTVRPGERWLVKGPNGAGKTALLSLLLTDNPQAYREDVALFGKRRGSGESIWDIRRRLGAISPELHLFLDASQSAIEVVGSGLHDSLGPSRPSSPAELKRARRWLGRLGVGRLAEVPFTALSEGEQRLALLARALVKEPELLVLDEPCQALDAGNRARFLAVLERMLTGNRKRPTTLVLVTHDPDEVPPGMTHALLLRRGRATRQGEIASVLPQA